MTIFLIEKWRHVVWKGMLGGVALTCFVALSVHTLIADLGVPYPHDRPKIGWTVFIAVTFFAWALMYFYRLTFDQLARLSITQQILLLFVLTAMLRESLVRVPVMDGFSSTAWIYSYVNDSRRLIGPLLVSLLVVPLTPRLTRSWQRVVAAIPIGAFVQLICYPLMVKTLDHLLVLMAPLNHSDIFSFPYDWHIEVPAYITYLEPVVASFVMVSLLWARLSPSIRMKKLQFTLLLVLIDGILVRCFLYPYIAKFTLRTALLSEGQFLLEAVTLGLGTAVTWRMFVGNRAGCQRSQSEAARERTDG